jgi:FKBP-type peptidyl-prolyl cis-trans isomerase (trigger factor)
MKTTLKKINACRREMTIDLPKEVVNKKFNDVYKEIQKKAHIKGFRPGMAPLHMVQAQHSNLAKEEVLKDLIPHSYKEALERENLVPINLPEITDVVFKDGGLYFKATFEVAPEVKIKKYKALNVRRKKVSVTEEDIEKSLNYLRESKGLDRNSSIDDSFARGLGYLDLNELKETIKKQLELTKAQQIRIDMENQIIQQLLKNSELEVPVSSVNKQLNYLVQEAKHRMGLQGVKKEEIDSKEKQLREQLRQTAINDVKVYFILDKIAELENIKTEQPDQKANKVMEFLLKEARWLNEETT